jgi:hypothetical protein
MPHAQQPQPAEFKTDEGLVLVDKLATPDMTMAHLIERLKTMEHLHQQISILTRLANDLGLEVTWMRLEGVEDCLRRNLAVLRLALDERC